MDFVAAMYVDPGAPTATPSSPTPAPLHAPAAGQKKKATTPKKEMTPLGRTINTKKCGNMRAAERERKAHQASTDATKVGAEMAIVLHASFSYFQPLLFILLYYCSYLQLL
jgi:hypothetical protein